MAAQITVNGIETTIRAFRGRLAHLQALDRPMAQTLIVLFAGVQRNFQSSSNDGAAWPPLAASTLKYKLPLRKVTRGPRKGQTTGGWSALPLIRSGYLRGAWDFEISNGGKTGVLRSHADYGIYHQKGGRHLPVRRMTPTLDRTRQIALAQFQTHRDDALNVTA